MVWNVDTTTEIGGEGEGAYVRILRVSTGSHLGSGFSAQNLLSGAPGRLRAGFLYSFRVVDGRDCVFPLGEVFPTPPGAAPAIFLVSHDFGNTRPEVANRTTAFGVYFAPARGATPLILKTWRLV